VAAFGTAAGRPLQGRGGSPGFRFTLYALFAVVIMYLDQRGHYLERLRYVLQAAVYPLQVAVNSPPTAWRWLRESVQTREELRAENARLRMRQRDLELLAMRYDALARENGELRGLREALPPVAERWLPAEIINIQQSSLRHRLLIDRGATNGVFKGQAVLDDRGLIGQTTHVGPWSAEVILITDPEHAVPVRVERTGLRTIAVGGGDASSLALPYLPQNADIRVGDLLITSGLGGARHRGAPRRGAAARAGARRGAVPHRRRYRGDAGVVPRGTSGRARAGRGEQRRSGARQSRVATARSSAPRARCTARRATHCAARRAAQHDGERPARRSQGKFASGAGPDPGCRDACRAGACRRSARAGGACEPAAGAERLATARHGGAMKVLTVAGVRLRMLFTALIALILTVLPLPMWLDVLRPAFLVLTVLYWSINLPRAGGIGLGFACGLLLDVFQGPVLGEHALALSIVAYIAVREHQRIRSKPAFQQSLLVLAALIVYEFVAFAIDGWTGHPVTTPLRWVHAFTAAIVWPPVAALLSYSSEGRLT
jgi:rod shape-determining protein MreC